MESGLLPLLEVGGLLRDGVRACSPVYLPCCVNSLLPDYCDQASVLDNNSAKDQIVCNSSCFSFGCNYFQPACLWAPSATAFRRVAGDGKLEVPEGVELWLQLLVRAAAVAFRWIVV